MHSKDPLFSSKLKMVLSVIFWGGSFIATKIAVRQFSPVAVVWLRFLIGILCLFPIILHKGMLHISGWKELAEYFDEWNAKRQKKHITMRGIVPDHESLAHFRENDAQSGRTMKVVPYTEFSSEKGF